jgi:catechol 2,3-dioxygenase-like lactoylglutathione lyase family enzyme
MWVSWLSLLISVTNFPEKEPLRHDRAGIQHDQDHVWFGTIKVYWFAEPCCELGSMISHFILYVKEQAASTAFYESVLRMKPTLNVPGMTEFTLSDGCILGLMPQAGIKRLLGNAIAGFESGEGSPRAELYLQVDNPRESIARAEQAGAKILSEVQARSWGHEAGYVKDLDGYILAFARLPGQ